MPKSHEQAVDLQKFADFVIEKWQTKIVTLGITDTRTLLNSFKADVFRDSNGNPEKIKFTFEYYGRFLDMGAFGKVKSFDWIWLKHAKKLAKANLETVKGSRKKYPWYSSVFARQVRQLADLMAKQYGYQSVTSIAEGVKKED